MSTTSASVQQYTLIDADKIQKINSKHITETVAEYFDDFREFIFNTIDVSMIMIERNSELRFHPPIMSIQVRLK